MCIRRTLVGNKFKHRGHSLNRDKIAYFHKKCHQFLTGGRGIRPQTPPQRVLLLDPTWGTTPAYPFSPPTLNDLPPRLSREVFAAGRIREAGGSTSGSTKVMNCCMVRAVNPRENCDLSCAKWGDHQKDNWNEPGETNHGVLPILLKLKSVHSRSRKLGVQRITVVKLRMNSGSGAGTGCLGRSRTAMITALRPWFHVKI